MNCKKCGNEIINGEKYCGKCGTTVEGKVEAEKINKTIKIKFTHLVIFLVIIVVIIFGCIFTPKIIESIPVGLNEKEMIEILKQSDNGPYINEGTVKVGSTVDYEYKNFNKIVSYSVILKNNNITLNVGGLMLYNSKTKENKLISLDTNLMSIIYYLNTENLKDKLESTIGVISKNINDEGELVSVESNIEQYMDMGKEIGQIVGVDLCRNVSVKAFKQLGNSMSNSTFLYKADEIYPRYIGSVMVEQEYCWNGILPENVVNLYKLKNPSAYNTMIALYGQPYKNVSKFIVFDFTKDGTPQVNKYSSIEQAKKSLNVEQ